MFDRRSASEKFRLAVRNLSSQSRLASAADPIPVLASIFRITLITSTTASGDNSNNVKENSESFQAENGTDWSSVLNPWLDVCEASSKVRFDIWKLVYIYICIWKQNSFAHYGMTPLVSCKKN